MKTYFALMFLFALNYVSCQNNNNDYFFTEKGEKYLKPVKYILLNPEIHKVNQIKNKRFYYLDGESFVFREDKIKLTKSTK
jgi:ABC-type enterochelin transport system substrate-binding protein